jgi:hypothetical protein
MMGHSTRWAFVVILLAGAATACIVTTRKGWPAVRQLHRDLSAVPRNHDKILDLAKSDPDLAAFFDEVPIATPAEAESRKTIVGRVMAVSPSARTITQCTHYHTD